MTLNDQRQRHAVRFGKPYSIRHQEREYEVLHFHDPEHGGSLLAVFDEQAGTRVTPWFVPPFCDAVAATIGSVSVSYTFPVAEASYALGEVVHQPRSAGRAQTVTGN